MKKFSFKVLSFVMFFCMSIFLFPVFHRSAGAMSVECFIVPIWRSSSSGNYVLCSKNFLTKEYGFLFVDFSGDNITSDEVNDKVCQVFNQRTGGVYRLRKMNAMLFHKEGYNYILLDLTSRESLKEKDMCWVEISNINSINLPISARMFIETNGVINNYENFVNRDISFNLSRQSIFLQQSFFPQQQNAGMMPQQPSFPQQQNAGMMPPQSFFPQQQNTGMMPPQPSFPLQQNAGMMPQQSFFPQQQNAGMMPPPPSFPQQQNTGMMSQPPSFFRQNDETLLSMQPVVHSQRFTDMAPPPPPAFSQQQNTGMMPPPSFFRQNDETLLSMQPVVHSQRFTDVAPPPPPAFSQQQNAGMMAQQPSFPQQQNTGMMPQQSFFPQQQNIGMMPQQPMNIKCGYGCGGYTGYGCGGYTGYGCGGYTGYAVVSAPVAYKAEQSKGISSVVDENDVKLSDSQETIPKTMIAPPVSTVKNKEVVFLLDQSDSMGSSQDVVIDEFRKFLTTQKSQPVDNLIFSLILFNTRHEILYNRQKISQVEPLTRETYSPNGETALYDTIVAGIDKITKVHADTIVSNSSDMPNETVFVIMTDGEDNTVLSGGCSRFDNDDNDDDDGNDKLKITREKIANARARGWKFIVFGIGNGVNAEKLVSTLGIPNSPDNVIVCSNGAAGVHEGMSNFNQRIAVMRNK